MHGCCSVCVLCFLYINRCFPFRNTEDRGENEGKANEGKRNARQTRHVTGRILRQTPESMGVFLFFLTIFFFFKLLAFGHGGKFQSADSGN